ncbi:hypothetical protein R1CP_38995 (plasmid) [Rhodococcus opacus]|uniref:Chorismate-utilising enzyme C-terminal domain-containing protein n=2 Tax=Rhodococcus opacus TaxID=37919 RepID=A0A1B1KI74_RHOOP|nr:hypothetical protein R1CP_38490 [Rhodococcus opacus]ANS32387.1 hypothetical protein R1CP_38995 [Rhodococcus opacus]
MGSNRLIQKRASYIEGDWGAIALFSQSSTSHGTDTSSPLSQSRGTAADCGPVKALRESTKDVAEGVMIVDLVRNDLGRVAILGTVQVFGTASISIRNPVCGTSFPRFAHKCRTVRHRRNSSSVVSSGAVTGCPKIRSVAAVRAVDVAGEPPTTCDRTVP